MNASIRDLRTRVENVEVPQVDVAALVAAGERRVAQRRAALTAGGVAAAVLAVTLASASLGDGLDRSQGPVDAPTSTPPSQASDAAAARELTYAIGSTIHYGERSIDVGGPVYFVDVTDDGVVFVRGEGTKYPQPAARELWFTDGTEIERIGSVFGSPARAYRVTSANAGSTVVWWEPAYDADEVIVFDTDTMQVLTRLPAADVLSVHADAVYWVKDDMRCEVVAVDECLEYGAVMKYDVATDTSSMVSFGTYEEDRRNRPRTIVGPYPRDADDQGTVFWDLYLFERNLAFRRDGTKLFAVNFDGKAVRLVEARTGRPIMLEVPAGSSASIYGVSQWLDDDTIVLFGYARSYGGSELADPGQIFTCSLSRGACRPTATNVPGALFEMPGLD